MEIVLIFLILISSADGSQSQLMELKVSWWSSNSADRALIQEMEIMISWWSSNSIGDLIKSADLGHPRWSLYQVFLVLFLLILNSSISYYFTSILPSSLFLPTGKGKKVKWSTEKTCSHYAAESLQDNNLNFDSSS